MIWICSTCRFTLYSGSPGSASRAPTVSPTAATDEANAPTNAGRASFAARRRAGDSFGVVVLDEDFEADDALPAFAGLALALAATAVAAVTASDPTAGPATSLARSAARKSGRRVGPGQPRSAAAIGDDLTVLDGLGRERTAQQPVDAFGAPARPP